MTKKQLILYVIILTSVKLFSQDLIVLKDGRKLKCAINKVDTSTISFTTYYEGELIDTYYKKEIVLAYYYDTLKAVFRPNNIIKTNIIGFLSDNPTYSYERVLSKHLSAYITYGFGTSEFTNGEIAEDEYLDKYHGYAVRFKIGDFKHITEFDNFWGVGFKFYLPSNQWKIPNGFHIGNSLDFYRIYECFTIHDEADIVRKREEIELNFNTLSLNIGYQILALNFISFEAVFSPGIAFINGYEKSGSHVDDINDSEFKASLSLNIGVGFGLHIPK